MNRHLFFSLLFCVFFSMTLSAQELNMQKHLPYVTDTLWAYKLPYTELNDSSKNCMWDVSRLSLDSATIIDICYFAPNVTNVATIGMYRERSNYYYNVKNDTLWMTGYESSQVTMHFDTSLPIISFPFAYGDSISWDFEGSGQYCHTMPIRIKGLLKIKADAIGELALPGVLIDSVLRIHTQVKYKEKSEKHYLAQEDSYQWYSPYCRYPLLETRKVQTFNGKDTILFATTYYYPQEQENLPTPSNINKQENVWAKDSLISNVAYLPNPVYSDLYVHFSLARDAQVFVSLHYNGGTTTYQTPLQQKTSGEYTIHVPTAGLPIGNYVVYIHADDMVVSGNIIKL